MPDDIFEYKLKVTAEGGGGAATAADIEKANAAAKKCTDIFKQLNQEKSYAAQADKEIAESVKVVSAEEVKAAQVTKEADEKAFASKTELRHAVHGLRDEFPLLGHVARLAVNPIALAVAGVGAAFAIFRYRVKAATEALTAFELPDLSEKKIGQITAAAEAYRGMNEAMDGVVKAYASVEAAAGRAQKRLEAEAEQQKKLLAAKKGLELAELEAGKSGMSGADYEKRKLDIEDRYERAGIKREQRTKQQTIQNQQKEASDLRQDAAKKAREAQGIKVGKSEQDAGTEADLKARAEAAQKDIDERRKRIGGILDFGSNEGGVFKNIATGLDMIFRYGKTSTTPSGQADAIGMERGVIASEQVNVDRYNAFMGNKAGREEARKRKAGLSGEAGAEMGRAGVIDAEVIDEMAANKQDAAVGNQVGKKNAKARVAEALGKAKQEEIQTLDEIHGLVTRGMGVTETLRQKVIDLEKLVTSLEARMTQPF
jgi:hypothetical protein